MTETDWQKGIGTLDPKAAIDFIFQDKFSTDCDNLQLFKALGIYDDVEQDVKKGYESAKIKAWGIPNAKTAYYDRTQRPKVTVISVPETNGSDMLKSVIVINKGKIPVGHEVTTTRSSNEFEKTIIDVSNSIEINAKTTIIVESLSSKCRATFSAKSEREFTKSYSEETVTDFTISTGEQLVKIKNPTQITKFKVRVKGMFCLNCAPRYNGHYLWMKSLDNVYECNVRAEDIGTNSYQVELLEDVGAE